MALISQGPGDQIPNRGSGLLFEFFLVPASPCFCLVCVLGLCGKRRVNTNKRGALLPKPARGDLVDSVLTLDAPPRSGSGGHRMDPLQGRPALGRFFFF